MKIQKKGEQYFLCLPKKVIEGIGWAKRDNVTVRIAGRNKLELIKE